MKRLTFAIAIFLPTLTQGAVFERPIPQPQSATAEWWFFCASLAFLAALLAVHLVVRRR